MDNQTDKMHTPEDDSSLRDVHEELVRRGDRVASHFTYWFAWFWGVVSVIYFFMVTFVPISEQGVNFANIILGFLLGTAVSTIINFFFGSSDT
jgi:hypothetical protein